MNPSANGVAPPSDGDALRRYYRLHAPLYDATRWSFLFGRTGLVTLSRQRQPGVRRILEIGCGTGKNLESIARAFPEAEIRGLDLSAEMLEQAGKRVRPLGDRR